MSSLGYRSSRSRKQSHHDQRHRGGAVDILARPVRVDTAVSRVSPLRFCAAATAGVERRALATAAGWRMVSAVLSPQPTADDRGTVRLIDVARSWPGTPPGTADVSVLARHILPTTPGELVPRAPDPDVAAELPASSLGARLYRRMPFYLFVEPFRRLFRTGLSWTSFFLYLAGGLWTLAVWCCWAARLPELPPSAWGATSESDCGNRSRSCAANGSRS